MDENKLSSEAACYDCGKVAKLRDYDADNYAGTEAVHYELCDDCYQERVD